MKFAMKVLGGLLVLLLAQFFHLGIGARHRRSIANAIFSPNQKLATDRPKLWAKRSRDPDVLWFQIREEDNDDNPIKTLRISVIDQSGEWVVEEGEEESIEGGEWIAIEGIYGFYKLPSGVMWILVTKTKPVYTAPPLNEEKGDPWWQIRRVSNFELVHLSSPDRMLATAHLKEEVRQLRLLRQSLKEHEFYFIPASESSVIKDMTCNLQDSIEFYLEGPGESTNSWWGSVEHRPDPRFFWNQQAVEPILQRYESEGTSEDQKFLLSNLLEHTIPLTSAFVGVQPSITDDETGTSYDQILISRRSRFRAGTRFTRRGADGLGAVANFAETEQICLTLNGTTVQHVMSHMQTRGSIPLRWSSPADVKTYRPRVRIGTDPLAQARALRLHLLEQFSYYVATEDEMTRDADDGSNSTTSNSSSVAKLIFINLIDKHKDQGRLGRAFDAVLKSVMEVYAIKKEVKEEKLMPPPPVPPRPKLTDLHSSPVTILGEEEEGGEEKRTEERNGHREKEMLGDPNSVEHIWFDFHAEVKDGRWDRLTRLLKDLQPALTDHGYFWADAPSGTNSSWKIRRTQTAIIRTNCMDCLDRTNVVQSLFGRYILFHQLHHVSKQSTAWESYSSMYQKTPTAIPWAAGELAHRLLWADNADAISRLYAGTAALKGDFTRTGKRTKRGALDDGMNSLQRYYLNNFLDADRQEGMDLLVGYTSFSNVDDDDNDYAKTTVLASGKALGETTTSSITARKEEKDNMDYISIKQAARENFFGKMIGRLEDKEKEEATTTLLEEEMGVGVGSENEESDDNGTSQQPPESSSSNYSGVDLRWLPGDLQSHMMSNADLLRLIEEKGEDLEEAGASDDDDDYERWPSVLKFDFSTSKALASIDRRSASDSPWWVADFDDDDEDGSASSSPFSDSFVSEVSDAGPRTELNNESDEEDEEQDWDLTLPEHQRVPRLERSQVLAVLVVGLRAPQSVASAVVALLSLIFLPAILEQDLF